MLAEVQLLLSSVWGWSLTASFFSFFLSFFVNLFSKGKTAGEFTYESNRMSLTRSAMWLRWGLVSRRSQDHGSSRSGGKGRDLVHAHPSCLQRHLPPPVLSAHFTCASVMSDSLRPHGLYPTRLLCSRIFKAGILEWVHSLLQRIFPTQGSNPCLLCLLHWQTGSLC